MGLKPIIFSMKSIGFSMELTLSDVNTIGLFFIISHCGFAAGEAMASHCVMFSQQGRDIKPMGAICAPK